MGTFFHTKYLLLWDRMGDYHRARVGEVERLIGQEHVWAVDLGGTDTLYGWKNGSKTGNYLRLSEKQVDKVGSVEGWRSFRNLVKKEHITHVCIPGYGRSAYLLMIIWSRLTGRRVLIFAESWYPGSTFADWLKGLFLKSFTHACFVSGERTRSHFIKRLRYPPENIYTGYSVVDNYHFSSMSNEKTNPPQLLCIARFSGEKNLELLIRAFKRSALAKNWSLVIVGGGPQKQLLQDISNGSSIQLIDWVSYSELPGLYARASVFVLPSRFEPWGLVVNEAMAAGLPIILSDQVGALPDLLDAGVNGWSFESGNEEDLLGVLNRLNGTDWELLAEMGKKSVGIISQFTTGKWAEVITGDW